MTTQVWGLLGSSKIILDRTDGNIWKVTVPFLESGEYIVALYALDDAGNQAYVATILYVVDIENIQYEIRMLDCFEAVLNGYLRKDNMDVFVTGSNAKLLSKDIITQFAGRGDEVHMYPLSFAEFMTIYKGDKCETKINQNV